MRGDETVEESKFNCVNRIYVSGPRTKKRVLLLLLPTLPPPPVLLLVGLGGWLIQFFVNLFGYLLGIYPTPHLKESANRPTVE